MTARAFHVSGRATVAAAVETRATWRRLIGYVRAFASMPTDIIAGREMAHAAREAGDGPLPCDGCTPALALELLTMACRQAGVVTPPELRAPWASVLIALADLVDAYLTEQQDRDARAWQSRMAD